MLLQRSKLAATSVERPRLAPPWSILMLGLMVLVVLVVIYPHTTLVKRVLSAPPDEITEAYLVNLLRTDPDNPQLRIVLARSQLRNGFFDSVRATLEPALADADRRVVQEATWLLWQTEEARFRKLPADAAERAEKRQELRRRLAEIADREWGEELLAEIARKTIAFGDIALGRRLFDRLAAGSPGKTDFWFADAGQTALANGEYRAAAEFYLIAEERVAAISGKRRYFLAAMHALQSGDRVGEALTMAEQEFAEVPGLLEDREILELMVRFARAARRPDLADKYARKLLRLALLEQWRRSQLAVTGFDASPRHVALVSDENRAGPQLPFDDRIYTLGFEAFLDNRKQEDAWKVAASAVRQAPDNIAWRERLARVSEWTGRPKLGLDNWLYVARATGKDEAWQAVLRLAPGLFDDEALRPALQYQLARHPGDEKLLRELAAIYERLGDPKGGLRFLEQTFARTKQPWILEYMAELAERMGDEGLALTYWKRLLASTELTTDRAVRVATLMLLRGQQDEALALLEQARGSASDQDTTFWRLTGQLSDAAQKDATAIDAYRRLIGGGEAEARDYDALTALLQEEYPIEAAQVSAAAWRRFRQPLQLLQAMRHYASRDRWKEIGQLLGELDGQQLRTMRRQADFLFLSAQYRMNSGQPLEARRDLEAAMQIAPDAQDIQLAMLWLLIDSGDGTALRRALATWEGRWNENPAMHEALGSAYLALSLPDVALRRYYTPHLAEHRNDFLWLMNYADALEQNQEPDRAWRLRQALLTQEWAGGRKFGRRSGPRGLEANELREAARIARTRLILSQRAGDPAFSALRELMRLDRDAETRLSAGARDLALGWLLNTAEYPAARGWLWQQYAKAATRPAWAEISLALAENDTEAAGQLLDRHGEHLPRHDRINAEIRVGDLRLAQSDAFETQTEQAADDQLHLQLTEALLDHSDHLGGELTRSKIGTVVERDLGGRWHVAISPRLTLDLALGSIARDNRDSRVIGTTPDESYRSARLVWRHPDGETRLTAEERTSFDTYHPMLLEHEQRIDDRLSLTMALGTQQKASESTALRIAGMKDRALLGVNYRPTFRDQLRVEYSRDRYFAQTGTRVGDGNVWQVEAVHALRLDPRSLEASVFWSAHRYERRSDITDERLRPLLPSDATTATDVGADFFLPNNFRYYGIRLSTDTRFEREYTRAWRPYATVAKTWHSELGPGYDLAAGIAGSVFGADHLNFGWKLGKGGANSGGLVREIGLTYRLHY